MQKLPYMQKACSNCPFRKDCLEGWLGESRMEEILQQDSFVCHKTANGSDEAKRQCGGHIAIKRESNIFWRIAKAIGINIEIQNKEELFDNEKDLIKHHKNGRG